MSNRLLNWLFPPRPMPEVSTRTTLPATPEDLDMYSVLGLERGLPPTLGELERAYAASSVVFACVQEITEMCSSAEIEAPLAIKTLLEFPNQTQDFGAFLTRVVAQKLCTNRVYILKEPQGRRADNPRARRITQELYVLQASAVYMRPGPFGEPYKRIDYDDGLNHYQDIDPDDLIIDTRPTLRTDAFGNSPMGCPLAAVWPEVQLDMLMTAFRGDTIGRLTGGMAHVETDFETNKKQRDELTESLRRVLGKGIPVMPHGSHFLIPDGTTLSGLLSMSELNSIIEARISGAMNVPAALVGLKIGLDRATYANISSLRDSLRTETCQPLLVMLGRIFSKGLGAEVKLSLPEPAETGTQPEDEQPDTSKGGQPGKPGQPEKPQESEDA